MYKDRMLAAHLHYLHWDNLKAMDIENFDILKLSQNFWRAIYMYISWLANFIISTCTILNRVLPKLSIYYDHSLNALLQEERLHPLLY